MRYGLRDISQYYYTVGGDGVGNEVLQTLEPHQRRYFRKD